MPCELHVWAGFQARPSATHAGHLPTHLPGWLLCALGEALAPLQARHFLPHRRKGLDWMPKQYGETSVSLRTRKAWEYLGGSVVERLPLPQVVIPASWDRVPRQAPYREPASPSAYVSAFLSVSLLDK